MSPSKKTVTPVLRQFKHSDYLFHEGDTSQSVFLVQKGIVEIRKTKGTGEIELGRIYANEVIGELSFFDRLPRSASAVASGEVEALEISFDSLNHVYSTVPDYLRAIIASLADRLRRANNQIHTLQREVISEKKDTPASLTGELTATEALALANQTVTEPAKQNEKDPVKK